MISHTLRLNGVVLMRTRGVKSGALPEKKQSSHRIKPQAYKRQAIGSHGDTTQWREIMGDEVHAGAIVLDTTYKSRVINASKILLNC